MIKNKRVINIGLFLLLGAFLMPQQAQALSLDDLIDVGANVSIRVQETFEYVFALGTDKKVEVLDKQAERRLERAQTYAEDGDRERVKNMISNYGKIKERQNQLLDKIDNDQVVNLVVERVVEQQQTMEEIKNWVVDPEIKEQMAQVQEQVVNQVATKVVEVNGAEGQTEFFQKVEHVWAPGTGSDGGETGVVIDSGTMQFAPGASENEGGGKQEQRQQRQVVE